MTVNLDSVPCANLLCDCLCAAAGDESSANLIARPLGSSRARHHSGITQNLATKTPAIINAMPIEIP
jgi:hypothetical protein